MTNPTQQINERVIFKTRHVNLRAQEKANALISRAKDIIDPELWRKYEEEFILVLRLLPLTVDVSFSFKNDEAEMLTDFKVFWEKYQNTAAEDDKIKLAVEWRMETSLQLVNAWYEQLDRNNAPVRHELSPEHLLSQAEREALQDDASPLVSGGKPPAKNG